MYMVYIYIYIHIHPLVVWWFCSRLWWWNLIKSTSSWFNPVNSAKKTPHLISERVMLKIPKIAIQNVQDRLEKPSQVSDLHGHWAHGLIEPMGDRSIGSRDPQIARQKVKWWKSSRNSTFVRERCIFISLSFFEACHIHLPPRFSTIGLWIS